MTVLAELKSNGLTKLIFYLRYYLVSSIKFDLEHTKGKWDAILASMSMFLFDMLNIVMILYEQIPCLD